MQTLRLFLASLLTLLTLTASADTWKPNKLPEVRDTITKVINPDSILADSVVRKLEAAINTLSPKGAEIYVVCVDSIDPDDPYQFAIQTARRYHVGGRRNLGALLLLATKSRAYQIVTGDAMEKILTDADCGRILETMMVPMLKQERWNEAVAMATLAMVTHIGESEELRNVTDGAEDLYQNHSQGYIKSKQEKQKEQQDKDSWNFLIGACTLIGGLIWWTRRDYNKKHTCPQCGKHHLKINDHLTTRPDGFTGYERKRHCPDCGYVLDKFECTNASKCPECGQETYQMVKIIRRIGSNYLVQWACLECGHTENEKVKYTSAGFLGGAAAEEIRSLHKSYYDDDDSGSSSSGGSSYSASDRDGGSFSGGGAGGRF